MQGSGAASSQAPLFSPSGWVEGWEKRVGVMRAGMDEAPSW
jgi:hypothetical protein